MGLTRRIHCEIWDDPWFDSLNPAHKLLYLYLWTTSRCDQVGLLTYPMHRIAVETRLSEREVEDGLAALAPKVQAGPDWVWVRAFICRQGGDKGRYRIAVVRRIAELVEQKHAACDFIAIRYPELADEAGYTIDILSEACKRVSDTLSISGSVSGSVSGDPPCSPPKGNEAPSSQKPKQRTNYQAYLDAWNVVAEEHGLARAREAGRNRKSWIRRVDRERGFAAFCDIVERAAKVPKLVDGSARNGWKLNLDSLIRNEDNWIRTFEQVEEHERSSAPQKHLEEWHDDSVRHYGDGLPVDMLGDEENIRRVRELAERHAAGDAKATAKLARVEQVFLDLAGVQRAEP